MSYSGKVVLGDSVDKLMLQTRISSIQDQFTAHWEENTEFFRNTETRVIKSVNNWLEKTFNGWGLHFVHWPFEIEDVENGVQINGDRCHTEKFILGFKNVDSNFSLKFSFYEVSYELDLRPFEMLEFRNMNVKLDLDKLESGESFDLLMMQSKVKELLEFLDKNFSYFKSLLQEEFDRIKFRTVVYSNEVVRMLEQHDKDVQALRSIEMSDKIQEFQKACEKEVEFDSPRRLKISSKTTIIAKAIRVQRIHFNHKYVAIEVKELELGLKEKVSFVTKSYEKVFIKTLFGFDLTQPENLKLLSSDF